MTTSSESTLNVSFGYLFYFKYVNSLFNFQQLSLSRETTNGSFASSDEVDKIGRRFSPRSSPPITKGEGVDAPFENCAKKRRVGTKNAHLYTPYCMEVISLCAPLAIEGHIDGDGEDIPAPVAVKLEGGGTGEERGYSAGSNHHGTGQTGGSCRRCLL